MVILGSLYMGNINWCWCFYFTVFKVLSSQQVVYNSRKVFLDKTTIIMLKLVV